MAVDVVVVNYHTDDLLQDFISSYMEHRFPDCTLTVVNVESNGMHNVFLGANRMELINLPTNVGYGKACNIGAALGRNAAILLANSDTLLTDGFKECYDNLMAHGDWGILGPRQVNEFGNITAGGIGVLGSANQQIGWNQLDQGQFSSVLTDRPFVSGSLLFVKRVAWDTMTDCPLFQQAEPEAIGAFIHTPHYFEDTWLGYHASAHGYQNVFYGPVQMIHLWHKSSPLGGHADNQFLNSQAIYRRACQIHGIQGE